jgi:hypothetical protein
VALYAADPQWDTPLFGLCAHMHDVPAPVHAVFCMVLLTLDKVWVQRRATYMQFPAILAEVEAVVVEALQRRPLSLAAFRARVEAMSGLEVPFVPPDTVSE